MLINENYPKTIALKRLYVLMLKRMKQIRNGYNICTVHYVVEQELMCNLHHDTVDDYLALHNNVQAVCKHLREYIRVELDGCLYLHEYFEKNGLHFDSDILEMARSAWMDKMLYDAELELKSAVMERNLNPKLRIFP